MRAVVVAFHVSLGLALLLQAVVVLLQARTTLLWEMGFYAEPSPFTVVLLIWGVCTVGLSLGTVAGGVAYARYARAGQWVLLNALLLMFVVPERVAWALLGSSLLVVADRWRWALRRRSE